MTIWRLRVACWITKSTDTHSEYVILIAILRPQWLHDYAAVLLYAYCLSCSLLRVPPSSSKYRHTCRVCFNTVALFVKALIVAVEQRVEVLVVKRCVLLMWPTFDLLTDALINLKGGPRGHFFNSVSVPVARDTSQTFLRTLLQQSPQEAQWMSVVCYRHI